MLVFSLDQQTLLHARASQVENVMAKANEKHHKQKSPFVVLIKTPMDYIL